MARPAVSADNKSRLEKLGIRAKLDFALHLPLRYEDETKLTRLADARAGEAVQVEAEGVESSVKFRPKRTLVVKLVEMTPPGAGDSAGASNLWVRFLNFYPSQVKQFA